MRGMFRLLCVMALWWPWLHADLTYTRIKDISHVEGIRHNMLVGYGLVVGLNGTGDTLRGSPFTKATLISMLDRLGVGTRLDGGGNTINTRNVAAVMVTAKLPPFARQGSTIDVVVSAMGDSKSLKGGTLLVTPLLGADSEVYAVAQGTLASSSFYAGGRSGTSVTRGVPTAAVISNGAIVERESQFSMTNMDKLNLSLRIPDLTTARRIEEVINENISPKMAKAVDSTTITLTIPKTHQPHLLHILSDIENLNIVPAQTAKVILDEREGVVVIGDTVHISTVAVSHGNLTVRIQESFNVSQPDAPMAFFGGDVNQMSGAPTGPGGAGGTGGAGGAGTAGGAGGGAPGGASGGVNQSVSNTQQGPKNIRTVITPESDVDVEESPPKKIAIIPSSVRLRDLVDGLNALQLPASDLSSVIRAINSAGALHAQLEIS
ncbi:flagellar basal body P-ring protein FlgI [bacterium NHP-B]|nr:flagellar basal body P-ring protein FlgI [bacterium NHP-B]